MRSAGMRGWIVPLLLAIVATGLGLLGKKRLEAIKGPEHSQASIEKTKAVLTRKPIDLG